MKSIKNKKRPLKESQHFKLYEAVDHLIKNKKITVSEMLELCLRNLDQSKIEKIVQDVAVLNPLTEEEITQINSIAKLFEGMHCPQAGRCYLIKFIPTGQFIEPPASPVVDVMVLSSYLTNKPEKALTVPCDSKSVSELRSIILHAVQPPAGPEDKIENKIRAAHLPVNPSENLLKSFELCIFDVARDGDKLSYKDTGKKIPLEAPQNYYGLRQQ